MSQPVNASRRNFIKGSAAVAGAAVASSLVAPRVYAAGDETLKLALVGCGGRGSGAASQALSTSGQVKLIAVADAFEDNAKGAAQRLKAAHPDRVDVKDDHVFSGFDAYQKALATDADVVILATPPGFRPMHFEAAVKAGKQIFMEKPVATDATGVRRVMEAAKEAKAKGLKVGVGLQRHHDPHYIDIVKRLQDGAIGDLTLLRVYWNGDRPWIRPRKPGMTEMQYQMRNWYYFTWLCGDHIVEQHIHNLDVANWIKQGPPAVAQGQGGRQVHTGLDEGEIFDHHFVEFTYPDGTKIMSQCRHMPGCWDSVAEHAHGTKGTADVSGFTINPTGGQKYSLPRRGPDPYQVEHDVFFDAVRNNKPHFEADYGATSTMMAIWGRMCTYSGKEITWDQALNSKVSVMPEVFDWNAPPPTLPDANGRYPIPVPGKTKVL